MHPESNYNMKIIVIASIILVVAAFAAGLFLIPKIVNVAHELHIYDLPDSRKVHTLPIPRLGGIIFMPVVTTVLAAVVVTLLRVFPDSTDLLWNMATINHFIAYLAGATMLCGIGMYDDVHGVSYKSKFIVQIVASGLLCVAGLWISNFSYVFFIHEVPWWIGMPFTIIFVTYVTNAMNLIDGIDGLSSGLSMISLLVIAILNIIAGHPVWAMMCLTYFGVVAAFFYYNVLDKDHKVFMGDSGSLTLGFTLAFLILHFWQNNPVWNPSQHNIGIIAVSTLVIPLLDVPRVMMSRLRDGRNPFLTDKNHIHHKLMRTGMKTPVVMVTLLMLSLGFIAINWAVASYLSQTLMVLVDIVLFCLMHIIINMYIYRQERKTGMMWDKIF